MEDTMVQNTVFGVYSIRDKVAEVFTPPFLALTKSVAIRMFKACMKEVPYPDDYKLFYIGKWSDKDGVYENIDKEEVEIV